jgi:hypothetical protein
MVLSFKRGEEESLGMAWNHFASLVETCPVVGLPDPVLLQHFWVGLLEGSAMNMMPSREAPLCSLIQNKEKEILEEIQDFSSPPVLGTKAAKRDDVELSRSIFEKA